MGKADGIVRCSKTCLNEKPPIQYCALVPSLVIIKLMTINYDVEIGSQVEKVQNSITNKRQWQDMEKNQETFLHTILSNDVSLKGTVHTYDQIKCGFPT